MDDTVEYRAGYLRCIDGCIGLFRNRLFQALMFSMRLPLPTMPFKTRLKIFKSITLINLLCCQPAFSAKAEIIESAGMKVRLQQVANGFGVIWGMASLDSNRL